MHLTVKKINISNARANKVEKLQLPPDFRSTVAASLCGELHHSNFGTEVCVDDDTYCTFCFIRRTGFCSFTNVENGLWMLVSQRPKVWSPPSRDTNPIDSSLWFFLKNNARFPSDADMNHKKRFLQKRTGIKDNFSCRIERSDL